MRLQQLSLSPIIKNIIRIIPCNMDHVVDHNDGGFHLCFNRINEGTTSGVDMNSDFAARYAAVFDQVMPITLQTSTREEEGETTSIAAEAIRRIDITNNTTTISTPIGGKGVLAAAAAAAASCSTSHSPTTSRRVRFINCDNDNDIESRRELRSRRHGKELIEHRQYNSSGSGRADRFWRKPKNDNRNNIRQPDHVRRPDSYTKYTLDDINLDSTNNRDIAMSFLSNLRHRNTDSQSDNATDSGSNRVVFKTRRVKGREENNTDKLEAVVGQTLSRKEVLRRKGKEKRRVNNSGSSVSRNAIVLSHLDYDDDMDS